MSELAETYLRQARSFLLVGEPERSVELLKKARVLSAKNPQILVMVLRDLANACKLAGRIEEAGIYYLQLGALVGPDGHNAVARMGSGRRRWRVRTFAACTIVVALAVICSTSWWLGVHHDGMMGVTITPFPATDVKLSPREKLLREDVGLVVVYARYVGEINGRHITEDVPVQTGSCFAIRSNGYLLTNRHVVDTSNLHLPPTLGDQSMALEQTGYFVCLGPKPSDRFAVKPSDVSVSVGVVDMAVLHIDRRFDRPLGFAEQAPHQGDEIYVAGYPGVVQDLLLHTEDARAGETQIIQKALVTGYCNDIEGWPSEVFVPQLDRGIVSVGRRVMNNVAYVQFDGVVSGGNSGGPVLDDRDRVIGMETLAIKEGEGKGNNWAIPVDVLSRELRSLLPTRQGTPD